LDLGIATLLELVEAMRSLLAADERQMKTGRGKRQPDLKWKKEEQD
jgi:hypothetical protein